MSAPKEDSMDYIVGRSEKAIAKDAANEATRDYIKPKLIIFFSDIGNFKEYTKILNAQFPKSNIIGSSTYIGLCKHGGIRKGIVAVGIEEGIECSGGVLENIDKYPLIHAKRIEESLRKFKHLDQMVCLEFTSGLINSEESALTILNSILGEKDIPVFGGSAGDDLKAGYTLVSYNGQVYKDSCVFVLIRNEIGKIKIYRENIYKPMEKVHVATKVDTFKRIVYEFDHRPAAQVMADDLGISALELPKYLGHHPWGRVMGGDIFITANREILKNNALAFHARVYKNVQMILLEEENYRSINEKTLSKIHSEFPKASFAVVVHCLARSLLYESNGDMEKLCKSLGRSISPFIGISGYGEQEGTHNFNHTMVIAVFE